MKVPLNWILELCPVDADIEKVAQLFTQSGSEVENIEKFSDRFSGVVVGEVTEVIPDNPSAGMTRCTVEFGGKTAQVLSRAPKIEVGALYPFAPVGATLFGGKTIREIEFEGVKSEGMLCSGVEIGLGEPKDRLLQISAGTKVGADVLKLLRWNDVVFEFEITPNRPDCYGVLGLARELSALTGVPLADEHHMPIQSGAEAMDFVGIELKDIPGCPRYTARIIENVKIGPSPLRIMGRLSASGIRPINNIVDATNYVMLLLSHPLHAFDYDRLNADRIIVRSAEEGEIFITLDGEERKLNKGHVLIATPDRAVAVGGIMGGQDSEVTDSTTRILLESAYFNPRRIRRASRQLGLSTESSVRFERGVDPNGAARANDECASLISFTAGGEVRRGIVDAYPEPIEPLQVKLTDDRIESVLGVQIPEKTYSRYLTALGIEKTPKGLWKIPTFRPDITREIDLVEEIGRLYCYDNIEPSLRGAGPIPARLPAESKLERKLAAILPGLGFTEIMSDPLGKAKEYEPFADTPLSELENPISTDYDRLRPAILPSLLIAASFNLNHEAESVRLYEFDKVCTVENGEHIEKYSLGLLMTGLASKVSWDTPERQTDIFDFKGIIEALLDALGIGALSVIPAKAAIQVGKGDGSSNCTLEPADNPSFAKSESFNILTPDSRIIGKMGRIAPEIAIKFDIDIPVFGAEIPAKSLIPAVSRVPQLKPIPRFPSTRRDVALIVDSTIPVGELLDFAKAHGSDMAESVFLFDIYEGNPIPQNKKSVGISAIFRDPKKTITDEDANTLHSQMVAALVKKFNAEIRK